MNALWEARLQRWVPGLVLALAALVRLARAEAVWVQGQVVALDGDSLRHLARMESAAKHHLHVPAFDPLVDWPFGGFEPWAPGFDVVGALMMLPFGAGSTGARLAACLLPPLLGVLLVWLTVRAARALGLPPLSAWATGLLVAFAPQLVTSSHFGRVDHHVWEAVTLMGLATWALRSGTATKRFEADGAAWVFFSLWGFDGAPLYIALVAAALLVPLVVEPRARVVGSGALALVAGAAASALSYAPMIAQHHQLWSYLRPSLLQPTLVAMAGLCVALAVRFSSRATSWPGRSVAVAGAALTTMLVAALLPPLREEVVAGLGDWLARRDAWIASIAEFDPFFRPGPARLNATIGLWGWAGIALCLVAFTSQLRARGVKELQWLLVTVAAIALTLLQMRFGRVAIAFFALSTVWGLHRLVPKLWWAPLLFAVSAIGLDARVRDQLSGGAPTTANPVAEVSLALRELDPDSSKPGVLASWGCGHYLETLALHGVLSNGFGNHAAPEGYALSESFWRGTEDSLDALMRERRLDWWVDGARNIYTREAGGVGFFIKQGEVVSLNAQAVRQWPLSAALFGGSGDARRGVPHLAHFWPRAASTASTLNVGHPLPDLWLFERVQGAVVEGTAAPGSLVTATLALEGQAPYVAWARVSTEGRYALTLPIPTSVTSGLRTGEAWVVELDGRRTSLAINEAQVREGAQLQLQ